MTGLLHLLMSPAADTKLVEKMVHDISYYRQQLRDIDKSITVQENTNKRLEKEYEKLDAAFNQLKKKKVEEIAKDIENKLKKKNLRNTLGLFEWRGKRKNDFDDFVNKETRRKVEQFRKDTEKYVKAVKKARDDKKKEFDRGVKALRRLYRQRDKTVIGSIKALKKG